MLEFLGVSLCVNAGGESWHILSLSAAMAVYVALTTPLVIVLAAMYIVRQRKKTHKGGF